MATMNFPASFLWDPDLPPTSDSLRQHCVKSSVPLSDASARGADFWIKPR